MLKQILKSRIHLIMSYYNQQQAPVGVPPPQGKFFDDFYESLCFFLMIRPERLNFDDRIST